MSTSFFILVWFAVSLLFESLTHIVFFRFFRVSFLKALIFAYLTVLVISLIFGTYYVDVVNLTMVDYILFVCIYSLYSYGYFHIINIGESSIRIRILNEINQAGGSFSRSEVLNKYNANDIVQNRIKRLTRDEQIIRRNDHYFIGKSHLLLVAKIFQILKKIVFGEGNFHTPYKKVDRLLDEDKKTH